MFFYKFCRGIGNVLFRIIFRFKVIGKENIPKEGRIIICANHISNIDPVTLGLAVPRPIRFMAKKELFEKKFVKGLVEKLGAFPVDRKKVDLSAIRTSMKVLKNEEVLGIFPEGTRVKVPDIEKAKPGITLISIKAEAPIVPVYIDSNYKPFRKLVVKIGKPMKFDEFYNQRLDTKDYKNLSKNVMKSIYDLKYK